jgi:hypothetical protein
MHQVQTGQVRRIAGALSQYVGTGDDAKAVRRGAPECCLTLFCPALATFSSPFLLLRWRVFRAVQLASLPGRPSGLKLEAAKALLRSVSLLIYLALRSCASQVPGLQ